MYFLSKIKVLALSFLLLLLLGCSLKKTREQEKIETGERKVQIMGITIESAWSYKYDLDSGIYTVYFMSKEPVEVKFYLSKEEKEEVFKKCHSLKLNNNTKEINFDGNCPNLPTLYQTLLIRSAESSQKIKVSSSCDYSNTPDGHKAGQVMEFINWVTDLVGSKPEVKAAPESDIIYY
ncbi:MAG TPA: hypothetical protein VIZ28_00430 [Chitinophagaceae bacterium]